MTGAGELFRQARVLFMSGARPRALALLGKVLEADPGHGEARMLLGVASLERGAPEAAREHFMKCAWTHPQEPAVWNNLGEACRAMLRVDQARACYHRAALLAPSLDSVHNNLGILAAQRGEAAEGMDLFKKSIWLNPLNASAMSNLAIRYLDKGEPLAAEALCRRALALEPDQANALSNLARSLKDQARPGAACLSRAKALYVTPSDALIRSAHLLISHYDPACSPGDILELHRQWDRIHAPKPPPRPPRNPGRPLKVGFVSEDFRMHPIGYFLKAYLQHHDPERIHATCYDCGTVADGMTGELRSRADAWINVAYMDDQTLAETVRSHEIQVLVDLAGHTAGNRLPAFALRPAPVQAGWAGYPDTTGLAAMDYIISDHVQTPPELDRWFTERVYRMPNGYICYTPPENLPPVRPAPLLQNGYLTFGCMNNLAKVNGRVARLWAEILKSVPGSRLLLKTKGLEGELGRRFKALFASLGVEPHRLDLRGQDEHYAFMDTYNEMDVALDPFPYSGGLTTCESLVMGVPVITRPGQTLASRHSATHLSASGLGNWIAGSFEEYVEMARSWAARPHELAELKRGLRAKVLDSPLCDGKLFALHMDRAFEDMAGQPHG